MASFATFCGTLGYKPNISAFAVAEAFGFKVPVSLWTVMNRIGAPVAPQLISTYISGGQFNWVDPSGELASPPAIKAIRKATSFDFALWPPGSAGVTKTFAAIVAAPGPGVDFFANGVSQWAYNYPGNVRMHGIYAWQVTSINEYGSTVSAKATFGTNLPTLSFTVAGDQESAIVYGEGFAYPECTVTASCMDYPTGTYHGNIASGVTIRIQCMNQGQRWDISVFPDDGSAPVTGEIHCVGGAFP